MSSIWEYLFPPRCIICDSVIPGREQGICGKCLPGVKYVMRPRCLKCGKAIREEQNEICYDCGRKQHYYEAGRALYEYESIAASIYRFKYKGRTEYARTYAAEIQEYLGKVISGWEAGLLVPVPLHKSRMRKRGYNQAALLAGELSKRTGIPMDDQLVVRCRNTAPQKTLDPRQRQNNLKKAFKIAGNVVKLSTIIIIDDIYTTGQTVDEVAEVLLEAGAKRIFFITLAAGTGL